MFAGMSLRRKIGFGFGIVLFLLILLGVISFYGVHSMDRDVTEVVYKNDVISSLFRREIDHLNWASEVSTLLTDEKVKELHVQTDPDQCAFGKWYNSEDRVLAEKQIPGLARTLAKLDEPHTRLHATAVEIEKLYQNQQTDEANRVYVEQTLPVLAEIESLLDECCRTAQRNVTAANEKTLRASSNTRRMIVVVGILALVFGSGLAYGIARGMTRSLYRVIERLIHGADETASAAQQVSSASQSLAQGASEQAAGIEETSSSIEEMSSMTKQNAANAVEARSLAAQAREHADGGTEAMGRMSRAIDDIKTSSDETAKIIKTIDDIAFQTNLLALNAAVEAARAGEAGKGFAVVAEEVRSLAMRSAEAARSTAEMIQQAVQNSDNGVTISQEVAQVLENITLGNRKVNELVDEIAAASEQQSQGIEQVNVAIGQMEQITQQNAANAEESASASEELTSQAEELNHTVLELQKLVNGARKRQSAATTIAPDSKYQVQPVPPKRPDRNPPPASSSMPSTSSAEEMFPLDDAKELADF